MFHSQPCFSSTSGLGFEERIRKEAPNQALGPGAGTRMRFGLAVRKKPELPENGAFWDANCGQKDTVPGQSAVTCENCFAVAES